MFGYHVRLAWLSLRQAPVLTALMVALIALGVGMAMTTLTIYYMMSSDPIPAKSDVLYHVRIDSWDAERPYDDDRPDQAPWQLTYLDALGLRELPGPERRAAMFKAVFSIAPEDPAIKPFLALTRVTDGDFFPLFSVPFRYGGRWSDAADAQGDQVVVLSDETNQKLFGGADSVGRRVRLGDDYFEVVGVLSPWQPTPLFYDLNNNAFNDVEDIFVPFSLVKNRQIESVGNVNCWGNDVLTDWQAFIGSKCIWIQFWIEASNPAQLATFRDALSAYVAEQKALGRHPRSENNQLDDVLAWMDVNEVVGSDNKVLVGLSFLFLAVCLFNAVGLLLARFIGKAPVIGVRRALGASKAAIFRQHLVEVGLIGLVGGLAGLALCRLGLFAVERLWDDYERIARMDLSMIGLTLLIAVLSSIVAGLYPTWRVCRTPPASYLKTQ